jgi:ferric-dicitrate binding protein FerR (iron transport regulator)
MPQWVARCRLLGAWRLWLAGSQHAKDMAFGGFSLDGRQPGKLPRRAGAATMAWLVTALLLLLPRCPAAPAPTVTPPAPNTARVIGIEGQAEGVESMRAGSRRWDRAYTNQVLDAGDSFRTGPRSRALLLLSDLDRVRVAELSQIVIPPDKQENRVVEFFRGVFYFFHRDRPGELEIHTRVVNAVVRGTEFRLAVAEDGATRLDLIDGSVHLENPQGVLDLRNGESAEVSAGGPPPSRPGSHGGQRDPMVPVLSGRAEP